MCVTNDGDSVSQSCDLTDCLKHKENYTQHLILLVINYKTFLTKLRSLDENKGVGPDGIPPIFVKKCADYLVAPLLTIFVITNRYVLS